MLQKEIRLSDNDHRFAKKEQPFGSCEYKGGCNWQTEKNIISCSVTSDGATGEDWLKRFAEKRFRIGSGFKNTLKRSDILPTAGKTFAVKILKGNFFPEGILSSKRILDTAIRENLKKPGPEVACLLRNMFSVEDMFAMELWWIIVMHIPLRDANNNNVVLSVDRYGCGEWLFDYFSLFDRKWDSGVGFAFVKI
jgi:hypothetical protein